MGFVSRKEFTLEQITTANEMRNKGASWAAVVRAIGEKTDHNIRCLIEPGFREKRNATAQSYERRKSEEARAAAIASGLIKPRQPPYMRPRGIMAIPSQAMLKERDYAYTGHQTLSMELLGDPRPGRSALDKKNAGYD